jgi:hypothetical protein
MHSVQSWGDLPLAIVEASQAGALGLAHLLRALNEGRIALLPVLPECSARTFKRWAAITRDRPGVVLIPDDDYCDRGPAGWPLSERVARWAASAILHAAGAEIAHYESAVVAAQFVCRVAIIECSTTTLPLWRDLVERVRPMPATLIIQPRDGGPHPIRPAREKLQ